MTAPRDAVKLMMKDAGILSVDVIIKEGYKLKEVAEQYYIDISRKESETGIGRNILGPVASLICCPTEMQKKVLKFLLESEEVTRNLIVEKFGYATCNLTINTLYAMGMLYIESRYVRRRNRLGYVNGARISVYKPDYEKLKKFWVGNLPELQHKKRPIVTTKKLSKKRKTEAKHNPAANTNSPLSIYRDSFKFLEDRVSLECFINLHHDCSINGACECGCHQRAPIN